MGPYAKNDKEADRTYVPEWKTSFKFGPIPEPLRRKHISTDAENLLSDIFSKNKNSSDLRLNQASIIAKIDAYGKIDYYSKKLLKSIISYLIDLKSPKMEFRMGAKATGDSDLWRPAYIKVAGGDNLLLHFGRLSPRYRKIDDGSRVVEPHVLHKRFIIVIHQRTFFIEIYLMGRYGIILYIIYKFSQMFFIT